jgi:hypothetical protein
LGLAGKNLSDFLLYFCTRADSGKLKSDSAIRSQQAFIPIISPYHDKISKVARWSFSESRKIEAANPSISLRCIDTLYCFSKNTASIKNNKTKFIFWKIYAKIILTPTKADDNHAWPSCRGESH